MGDFFDPNITNVSKVSGAQQSVQQLLSQQFGSLFARNELTDATRESLLDLLGGTPGDISAISDAALRRFDLDIEPRIGAGFAKHGASLSSRRGIEVGRSLGDLQSQVGVIQAGLIESARNRQLGAAQAALNPFGTAAGFGTAGTLDALAEPSLFSQLSGLGGQLGSAALLGK